MSRQAHLLGFGPYELDLMTSELRKHGLPLKLQPQPFRVLALLASSPGLLITRQRIQEELWGGDVTVEFDAGLNSCIRQIRSALCDEAAQPRYIETLSKRGYRFLPEVVVTWRTEEPAEIPRDEPPEPAKSRRWLLAACGTAAAGLAAGAGFYWMRDTGIRVLAILPFESAANDAELADLSDGLTDSLIQQVAEVPALTVRPSSAVGRFKGGGAEPRALGAKLQVDAVVSGKVVRQAGLVSVRVELVDVRRGNVLWTQRYDRHAGELWRLQDEIAAAIVDDGIRLKLSGPDRQRLARHTTQNPQAAELYQRALFHQEKGDEEGYRTARELLIQATELDSKFALAYGMLAANYSVTAMDGYMRPADAWPLVRSYAQQALVLDGLLAEPHLELASEALFHRWDWEAAEREFEISARGVGARAVEVVGGHAMERWAAGDAEGALRLIRKGLSLDPISPSWRRQEADMLACLGRLDEAASIYEAIMRDFPEEDRSYFGLAEVRRAQKRFDEAIALVATGYAMSGADDGRVRSLAATARGERGYAEMLRLSAAIEIEGLKERAAASFYVSPLDFARGYARLGRRDEALEQLRLALEDRSPGVVFLKVDRVWDGFRQEPAFQELVRQVGLGA